MVESHLCGLDSLRQFCSLEPHLKGMQNITITSLCNENMGLQGVFFIFWLSSTNNLFLGQKLGEYHHLSFDKMAVLGPCNIALCYLYVTLQKVTRMTWELINFILERSRMFLSLHFCFNLQRIAVKSISHYSFNFYN